MTMPVPSEREEKVLQGTHLSVSYELEAYPGEGHAFGVNSLALLGHNQVFSAGRDCSIRHWRLQEESHATPTTSTWTQHRVLQHHTDWVNDLVTCYNGKRVISCSSDTTLKVWDVDSGECVQTLSKHRDYVKALAYAASVETLASAALDGAVYLWDLNSMRVRTTKLVCPHASKTRPPSLYCIAMNAEGTVVATGSPEKFVRLWDPRTANKIMKLRGHTENIKAIAIDKHTSKCLSASSDGTIKLWDLRNEQCVQTIRAHTDSVWSISVDESFSSVFSVGKDMKIVYTNLDDFTSKVIQVEKEPILHVQLSPGLSNLWTASLSGVIKNWELDKNLQVDSNPKIISSRPGITQNHVLNNKKEILTLDSSDNVLLWDITKV